MYGRKGSFAENINNPSDDSYLCSVLKPIVKEYTKLKGTLNWFEKEKQLEKMIDFLIKYAGTMIPVVKKGYSKEYDDFVVKYKEQVTEYNNMFSLKETRNKEFEQRLEQQRKEFKQQLEQQKKEFEQRLAQQKEEFKQKLEQQKEEFEQEGLELTQEIKKREENMNSLESVRENLVTNIVDTLNNTKQKINKITRNFTPGTDTKGLRSDIRKFIYSALDPSRSKVYQLLSPIFKQK